MNTRYNTITAGVLYGSYTGGSDPNRLIFSDSYRKLEF